MIMPQNEAKFRYCPFLKTSDDKMRFCVGAQCMMWRYKHPQRNAEGDEGYCGLAGKPAGAM
ncbi:hypothetical protein ACR4XJ_00015 [Nitratidesulfovibrio sp. D1]|uniref:hypothetical protein n=1 Tax=unclassified Nitratidesulfovibrio TaxID=2802296 RepID=UPI002FD8EE68